MIHFRNKYAGDFRKYYELLIAKVPNRPGPILAFVAVFAGSEIVFMKAIATGMPILDNVVPVLPMLMVAPAEVIATWGAWKMARHVENRMAHVPHQQKILDESKARQEKIKRWARRQAVPLVSVGLLFGQAVIEWNVVGHSEKFQTSINANAVPAEVPQDAAHNFLGGLWQTTKGIFQGAGHAAVDAAELKSSEEIARDGYLLRADIKCAPWVAICPFLSDRNRALVVEMAARNSMALDVMRDPGEGSSMQKFGKVCRIVTKGELPEHPTGWNQRTSRLKAEGNQLYTWLHSFLP